MVTRQNTSGFQSIRHRILIFSVLVTLVPSFGMGWYFYDLIYRATADKIEQRLIDVAGIGERAIDQWFKERDHDLRVFSNSPVIIDNLTKYLAATNQQNLKKGSQTAANIKKVETYLTLVKNQFHDYRRLGVLDNEGQALAVSGLADEDRFFTLPPDWKDQIGTSKFFIGEVYSRVDENSPMVLIGVPLLSAQHRAPLGVFAVEIRLQGLLSFLKPAVPEGSIGSYELHLVQNNGRLIVSISTSENRHSAAAISPEELRLFTPPRYLRNFNNDQGKPIVGVAIPFKNLPWGLVIEQSAEEVFAEVIRLRDRIALMAVLFALIIGLSASFVVRQILIPLGTLMQGVLRVSNGELDISLDIKRNNEFGIVIGMFNTMVKRLKQSQQELELLATTDTLTRLANRKQVMVSLKQHIEYYRRHFTEFSILLIDIDFFKTVNDTHGHLTGDAVLFQMAQIFMDELRTIDIAGRYGGEEFLIILGQTDIPKAVSTAERIRKKVEQHSFTNDDITLHLTISIGVAGITQGDDTDNSLIGRADRALYEAKASGRNRVVSSAETL